jgi:hypothetical protein
MLAKLACALALAAGAAEAQMFGGVPAVRPNARTSAEPRCVWGFPRSFRGRSPTKDWHSPVRLPARGPVARVGTWLGARDLPKVPDTDIKGLQGGLAGCSGSAEGPGGSPQGRAKAPLSFPALCDSERARPTPLAAG